MTGPTTEPEAAAKSGTQAIDRAAHLLSLVVHESRAVTFTELIEAGGYARSTTSRLLAALERHGLVERELAGAYTPGPLFAHYAARLTVDAQLASRATPYLRSLGEVTGETVNLAVARSGSVVQVAQVESRFILGSRNWVGVDVPPHCSSLGKVLYAYGAVDPPVGALHTPTLRSLATADAVIAEWDQIRRRGYATTVDELEVGLTGLAAPVVMNGVVIAALGISGPSARLTSDIHLTGRIVASHAQALSERLSRTQQDPMDRKDHKEGAA